MSRMGPRPIPVADRFWTKVDKRGPRQPHMRTRCWEWTAGRSAGGYGAIAVRRIMRRAHRVAWWLCTGRRPPPGLMVCHHCDYRACVRPDHLFLGTQKANKEDCVRKGRSNRGERHGHATLTEKQVRLIRSLAGAQTQSQLAARFGVSQAHISSLQMRKRWTHI